MRTDNEHYIVLNRITREKEIGVKERTKLNSHLIHQQQLEQNENQRQFDKTITERV